MSVFFVVSGFVMVHISWTNFGTSKAAANFMQRRIIRIVPLYWAANGPSFRVFFFIAYPVHTARSMGGENSVTPWRLSPRTPGVSTNRGVPFFRKGGTWNFRIMFYFLFAIKLFFPRRVALAVELSPFSLVAFAPFGSYIPNASLAYLASPITIILWFALGMALAISGTGSNGLNLTGCQDAATNSFSSLGTHHTQPTCLMGSY